MTQEAKHETNAMGNEFSLGDDLIIFYLFLTW